MKKIITVFILFTLSLTLSFAHGGRVDSSGGHKDKKTGSYHTHGGSGWSGYSDSSEYTGDFLTPEKKKSPPQKTQSERKKMLQNELHNWKEAMKRIESASKKGKDENISTLQKTLNGKCINIDNEKTINILSENKNSQAISLYGIKLPKQDISQNQTAKQTISDYLLNKELKIIIIENKFSDIKKAKVYLNDIYINLELIKKGLVLWNKEESPNDNDLKDAENNARQNKIGLWSSLNNNSEQKIKTKSNEKSVENTLDNKKAP